MSTPTSTRHSLHEVYRSVAVRGKSWRRAFAFVGPGLVVGVGYMDPGNWATDLAAGSRYGYALLWAVLASSLMAIVLQSLCVRLGVGLDRDLAQACGEYFPRPVAVVLWFLCEIAIVACDLAEVVGSAVALNLLFGMPLLWGVLLTSVDVLALLALMRYGFRKLEALVATLVGTVFLAFAWEIFLAKPSLTAVGSSLVTPSLPEPAALLIVIGILGATVMPHNLYLHSALVQTRAYEPTDQGRREAVRYGVWDTVLSLGAAFFVNAAILVLAASVFHPRGQVVEALQDAHSLLKPLLASSAATLFAVALLASGQSSTITGTLAGQIVMEGFLNLRVSPWARRIVTRLLAIVPAVFVVVGAGGQNTVGLLVVSQVVLSLQLPFAVLPLLSFVGDRRMGAVAPSTMMLVLGWMIGITITVADAYLLWTTVPNGQYWASGAAAVGCWMVVATKRGRGAKNEAGTER